MSDPGSFERGDELIVTPAQAFQVQTAGSADRFLIVWLEHADGGGARLVGRIVRASDGQPAGASFLIATGPTQFVSWQGPALSGSDDGFLVMWGIDGELRAARISLEGAILDPGGFIIVPPHRESDAGTYDVAARNPLLAWSSEEWVAVWAEFRADSEVLQVRGTRVSRTGQVRDGEGVLLPGRMPEAVAWNGTDYVLLVNNWTDTESSTDIVLVSPDLRDQLIGGRAPSSLVDSIASRNGVALLTYKRAGSEFVEIDADGNVREETRMNIGSAPPNGPHRPWSSGAFAEGNWLIAREEPGTFEPDVFVDDIRVFAAAWSPRVAVAGDVAIVSAMSTRGLVARVFPVTGALAAATPAPTTPPPEPSPTPPTSFGSEIAFGTGWGGRVAATDDRFLVAWSSGAEMRGTVMRAVDGAMIASFLIEPSRATQFAVASNGDEFIVVWPRGYDVVASRISAKGVVKDPGGVLLWENPMPWTFNEPVSLTVAWTSRNWVVAWQTHHEILALRVAGDLTPLDSEPRSIHGNSSKCAAFPLGDGVALTYRGGEIASVVVSADGRISDEAVLTRGSFTERWGLASNRTTALLAYHCEFNCRASDPPSAVYNPRTWLVEVDARTGTANELSRRPHSGNPWRTWPETRVGFASRWFVVDVRNEDGPSIYFDDTLLFRHATFPNVAVAGEVALVVASSEESGDWTVVGRRVLFDPSAGSISVPLPVDPVQETSHGTSACSMSLDGTRPVNFAVLAFAAWTLAFWRRRRL